MTSSILWAGFGLYILGIICTIIVLVIDTNIPRLETPAEQAKREELQRVLDRMREGRY